MEKKVLFSSGMHSTYSLVDENVGGIIIPDNTITHVTSDDVVINDKIANRYGNDNLRGIHLKDHLYKKNYTKKRHKRK